MGDPIVVVGGSLAGMAAAARLAKAGHRVLLLEKSDRLGGRWAADGPLERLPPVFTFPAPWRDLLRKSGRPFDAELARYGLALVPAPPAVHAFPDGTELALPSDRGAQWTVLSDRYGTATATRWRDLLDSYDVVWQVLRRLGIENEFTDDALTRRRRSTLQVGRSLDRTAEALGEPNLGAIVRSIGYRLGSDPRHTPAFAGVRLALERTFGRWMLTERGIPVRASRLVEILAGRLELRGVEVRLNTEVRAIDVYRVHVGRESIRARAILSAINPWTHLALAGRTERELSRRTRRTSPALAPLVSVRRESDRVTAATEFIQHTARGPIIQYRLPDEGGSLVIVHDHSRAQQDPGYGTRWAGWRTWLRMPPLRVRTPMIFLAGSSSRGGNDPWAQLLSGALATYEIHEVLTGADIRPTNKALRT